jgi:hypothetical protein
MPRTSEGGLRGQQHLRTKRQTRMTPDEMIDAGRRNENDMRWQQNDKVKRALPCLALAACLVSTSESPHQRDAIE